MGFSEDEVLGMPLNKVSLYAEAARRQSSLRRRETVVDLVNSIGLSFSGKGLDEYLKTLEVKDG